MDLISKKKKIHDTISALKVLAGDTTDKKALGLKNFNVKNGLPKLKVNTSLPSLNNGKDPIKFLLGLVTSLVGFSAIMEGLTTSLSYSLPNIVEEILNLLSTELKSIVSCGVDPSIPSFLTNPGIIVEVKKIDSLGLFKIDPASVAGKMLYQDVTPILTQSHDFNTFLYGVIQDDGNQHSWKNMLNITFNSIGITGIRPNNTLTIKASGAYGVKTLTDLNNDFLKHLSTPNAPLIDSKKLVTSVVDSIYGTVSSYAKKTLSQLELEAKIDTVVDSLTNSDSEDEIDDSYFTFTNKQISQQQETAVLKQQGIVKLECCNKISASIPISQLTSFNDEMDAAVSNDDKRTVIANNLASMANQTTANSTDPSDDMTIKVNFIQTITNNLIKAIVGNIISPKVITIFLINYKVVYGQLADYDGIIDFLKKNKNLIKALIKKVTEILVKILIAIALKKIAELVAEAQIKRETEKAKTKIKQIMSLTGVNMHFFKNFKLGISLQ